MATANDASDDAKNGKADADGAKPEPEKTDVADEQPKQKFNPLKLVADHKIISTVVALVIVVGAVSAMMWWLNARHFESTDDATLDTPVATISAPAAGTVKTIAPEGTDVPVGAVVLVLSDPLGKSPDISLPAPLGGRVTKLMAAVGGSVQPGQQLFAIIPPTYWVTANFKETQLADMRQGQEATIHLDAYPGREFKGHVDGFQAGTGAAFSLLPTENATGNYVKTIQRVPVRIAFDTPPSAEPILGPGFSASVDVRVR